jgi:hypothetical protein
MLQLHEPANHQAQARTHAFDQRIRKPPLRHHRGPVNEHHLLATYLTGRL